MRVVKYTVTSCICWWNFYCFYVVCDEISYRHTVVGSSKQTKTSNKGVTKTGFEKDATYSSGAVNSQHDAPLKIKINKLNAPKFKLVIVICLTILYLHQICVKYMYKNRQILLHFSSIFIKMFKDSSPLNKGSYRARKCCLSSRLLWSRSLIKIYHKNLSLLEGRKLFLPSSLLLYRLNWTDNKTKGIVNWTRVLNSFISWQKTWCQVIR